MRNGITCCKDCDERYLGCHDCCEKYLAERKKYEDYKAIIRKKDVAIYGEDRVRNRNMNYYSKLGTVKR